MPEAVSGIISIWGDSPRTRLLEYMMEFPKDRFSPNELVKAVGMSRTTVFREIRELARSSMIRKAGTQHKSVLWQINTENAYVALIQKSISLKSMEVAELEKKKDGKFQAIIDNAEREFLKNHLAMIQNEAKTTRNLIKGKELAA